jgi:hypothetical protein
MSPRKALLVFLGLLSAALCTVPTAAQNNVTKFTVDNDTTEPSKINDLGTVVGTLGGAFDIAPRRAFIRRASGKSTIFQVPVGSCTDPTALLTFANGINNFGVVVGVSECFPTADRVAFVRWHKGKISKLTDPHGEVTPAGINDFNRIIGFVEGYTGFVRDGKGKIKYLRYKNSPVRPSSINDFGVIVGTLNGRGFIYFKGQFRLFKFTASDGTKFDTTFLDVNQLGDVLGYYVKDSTRHFFVFTREHKFKRITLPNLVNVDATSFNLFGDVVGTYGLFQEPEVAGFIAHHLAK